MRKHHFYIKLSKSIIDEIDPDKSGLAKHGVYPADLSAFFFAEGARFTEEESDFIINYDIKYRMGKELAEE